MRFLVLGGAGYIGSHFVKQALAKGNEVIVIDNLQTGHKDALNAKAIFYQGDIRDKSFLKAVFSNHKIDVCVHFAANSLVGESMEKPLLYFDNNVYGTIVLLDTMLEFGVKRIVFSSSAAVYGIQKEMPITESALTTPANPYGESKLMMEKIMKWSDVAQGMRYVSLRYFNVAGAASDASIGEDHRPETHLIPIVLQVPLGKRENVTIYGNDYDSPDGTCVRDYIHIDDLIRAHLLAADYLIGDNPSDIFNLGSQSGYTNLEILQVARKVTGHPIPMQFGPRRKGDPDKLVASNKKAGEILGWRPENDLETIIGSAWAYHRSHPQGYKE
ncbi:MAG: UDP-glucose 4-epimerase GalE [Bacilli bacterium]|nr:UDP-glucose 4-epimerase GalE [Bacilli bacterium]MBN2697067.1 UDP-glucose 4-epimerase GalE [Bacilli bacterium]